MTRKNVALLAVLLVSGLAILAGVRLAAPTEAQVAPTAAASPKAVSDVPDSRPSPVAESVDIVIRPNRQPRKQQGQPASKPMPEVQRARSQNDGTKDWSVVAATLSSVDAADRRAASLKSAWRECACTVFPKGESERYYVVVGSGLDHDAADRLRERATSAGLPGDTYVTKLIRRPGDAAP